MNMFVVKLVFMTVLIGAITWVLAGYNGRSWTAVIILIVVGGYHFITTQTVLGRHIYAIGGNPETAQLSGVNVRRMTWVVFGSMGFFAVWQASCSRPACTPPHQPPARRLNWMLSPRLLSGCIAGRWHRQGHRVIDWRVSLHVPDERHELDGRRHRFSVYRQGCGACSGS
jgi:hypothetical protein